jgi:hypothetical protein
MNRLLTAATLLLCAISCTDQQQETVSSSTKTPGKWISVEDRHKSDKQSANGRTQEINPYDPFEFLCLEDPVHYCCADRPMGAVLTWTSSTHSFASGSPYRFAYDGPSGKSNYRITATAGQDLTYSMRVTDDSANLNPSVRMTIVPRDGQYASLTTSYGTVTYDPANGGEIPLTLYELFPDVSVPTHTFTIPKNPYSNRELKVKLEVPWLAMRTVPGYEGCVYVIPLNSTYPNFYTSDLNDRPWVEITLPRTAPPVTEFVNAGAAVYVAAGAPLGTGTVMPIPYPTTVTVGNLLLMVSTTRVSGSVPVGPPAGWSTFASYPSGIYIYSKIATGGESGNVNLTWTATTTNNRNGRIYQFKDASPTAYSVNTDNSTSTAKCGSMTSTNAIDLAVSFIYSSAGAAVNTYTGGALTWSEPVGDSRGLGLNVAPFTTAGQASGIATQPVQNNKTLNFVLKY